MVWLLAGTEWSFNVYLADVGSGLLNHRFTVPNIITCLTLGPGPRQQPSADAFQTGALMWRCASAVLSNCFAWHRHLQTTGLRPSACSSTCMQPRGMRFTFDQNHTRRRFFSRIRLKADSVFAVETWKAAGEICSDDHSKISFKYRQRCRGEPQQKCWWCWCGGAAGPGTSGLSDW